MITVKRLTLEDAKVILQAAEAGREMGVTETICVCDDGGHPLALHRMTGARITGVEIAIAKAFTAAGHRRPTHRFNEPPGGPALPGNEAFGIHAMHPGRFAIFVGGFPIEVDGQVVGGIGVSGGTGEQDVAGRHRRDPRLPALARVAFAMTDEARFDPFAPEFHEDPYPAYRGLREREPVHRLPIGAWVLTRYDDVAQALRDPRLGRTGIEAC